MTVRSSFACLLVTLAMTFAPHAANFRWTSQADALSLDPHAAFDPLSRAINLLVYERLFFRDQDARLVPWLAESLENPAPTRWIVRLRKGVKFHDGTALNADDVVFSFNRASRTDSSLRVFAIQAGKPRKIDDHSVELTTSTPNPVMAETLASIPIMSMSWCEGHRVARPQDLKTKEETYAVRHAMGTGPFVLVSREPGVRTVHRRNPDWWGIAAGRADGNVETVEHVPLDNPASRFAALKSRAVDFVLDPSPQDVPRLREDEEITVWNGAEKRVVYVAFDLARDELLYGTVRGRNPFKDRDVRMALYQAIDGEALHRQVMRGASIPTSIALHDPAGAGVPPELERKSAFDPESARRLLAKAGYPQGFGFTLHCPGDRMLNGERICLALAAMWARVGLQVRMELLPQAVFLPKAQLRDMSVFLMSYGGSNSDAIFMWKPLLRSPSDAGRGVMNYGNARIEKLDALIDSIDAEMDRSRRQAMIDEAVELIRAELPLIPLHRPMIVWASRKNVTVVPSADNILNVSWVRVR